ncbi:hypothetical protein [Abyssisolibacter fermentans]|uniref:hypothetical protein n=1 Tax=Abyssisolibacter fermentans TaxID=1766203 RepID=UPI0008333C1A|nr:hypothetical protein [Abyssisolibacter fermentans]
MEYNSKTNWQRDDIVTEKDLNRIEQGIEDACGKLSGIQEGAEVNRPISDAVDLNDSNTSASSMAVKTNADKIGNLETKVADLENSKGIENEGFNIQKNHRYEITHANSLNYNAMKNHYLLIQIADIILQLYTVGCKILKILKRTLKNISSDLLDCLEAFS